MTGCSLALEDGQPGNEPVKFEGPGESCLDNALPAVQKFFSGDGVSKDIDAAWTCLSGALKTFETHVRGEHKDRYAARELQAFLQRFFLREQQLSDSLVLETMRIKQMLLGGDLNHLTREEFQQVYVILDTFRTESVKLSPYMKILNLDYPEPKTEEQRAFVERGLYQLVSTGATIGRLLGKSQNAYHLSDAATFLREFGKLYSKDKEWDGPDKLIRQLPLVAVLKSFFLRPTGNSIAPDEWRELVAKAARLFGLYMRTHYLFPNSLTSGEGLRQVSTFVGELFAILDESVQAKNNKIIEYRQIDDLIDHLYKMNVLKLPVGVETAKALVKTAVGKMFNPSKGGERKNAYGITDSAVGWMRKDFFGWTEVQSAWDSMNAGAGLSMGELRKRWATQKLSSQDSAAEVSHLLGRPHPLAFSKKGTVVFDHDANAINVSRESWTELNWRRTIVRLLIRGFASDAANENLTGLKKENYLIAFEEMRPLAEALDLIAPGDQKLKVSLFDEANLFMPSADGNDQLSFHEGIEIMSFILSGTQISAPINKDTNAQCKQVGRNPNGDPRLDHNCVKKLLEDNLEAYFEMIPNWVKMLKKLRGEKWNEFYEHLLKTVSGDQDSPDGIRNAQVTKAAVIFQYIESLFIRFDTDGSGTLNLKESMVAYPLLYPVIRDETKDPKTGEPMGDSDIEAIYTYFLRYGERPDKNLGTKIKYIAWKLRKSSWEFEADRFQVLRVVAQLAGD